jgi:hypothetical protein
MLPIVPMRRGAALAPLRYPKVLGPALQTGGALLLRRAGKWGRFQKKPIFMTVWLGQ